LDDKLAYEGRDIVIFAYTSELNAEGQRNLVEQYTVLVNTL